MLISHFKRNFLQGRLSANFSTTKPAKQIINLKSIFQNYSTEAKNEPLDIVVANIRRKVPKIGKTNQSTKKLRRTPNDSLNGRHAIEDIKKLYPVTSFSTCDSYDLKKVEEALKHHYYYNYIIPDEIIHTVFPLKNSQGQFETYDVMILSNGTIVAWGVEESVAEKRILPLLSKAEISSYVPESEELDYVEFPANVKDDAQSSGSTMNGDVIVIKGPSSEQKLLDKAAFSSGLSRTTRLSILETSLENHILKTKENSINLSIGKKLTINEAEVLKLTGRLFLLRGKLNLYSELIETPDLYWSEPNLEKIYVTISRNLDIAPRISILNRKLDYATEESRALLSVLNEKKGTRLEWIIIILIMVEVCFETFHFYERYVLDKIEEKILEKLE